jgi:hypothetical protein
MMAHVESGHNVNVHHRDRSARSTSGSVRLPIKRDNQSQPAPVDPVLIASAVRRLTNWLK